MKQKILNNINLGEGRLGEELVYILTKSVNQKTSVEAVIIEEAIKKENNPELLGNSLTIVISYYY